MHGGLHLLAHKELSVRKSIATPSVPKLLHIVIRDENRDAIVVANNQRVSLGEPIARTTGRKAHRVLAPAAGTIVGIEKIIGANSNATSNVWTVTLDNDFTEHAHESVQPIADFTQLSPVALCARIERAGILGLGGAAFPTARKLASTSVSNTLTLIINGAECEPFITCDDALMREHADDIVLGARAIMHACNASSAIIAVETDKSIAFGAIQAALASASYAQITACAVDTLYPTGDERQLITLLTAREVPSAGMPADVGVLCQNVGTAAAVAQLIRTGRPLIERIVTLTGSAISQPCNLRVRFGTPIRHLIAQCGGYVQPPTKLIVGGSMMGIALDTDEAIVDATTHCLIAATAADFQSRTLEMPCIRCGNCSAACPANLLPQQLLRYARLGDGAALQAFGLDDCIECGCCDYVCPSHIPLASQFIASKLAIGKAIKT